MSADNVIKFPKSKKNAPPDSKEELEARIASVEEARLKHIELVGGELMEMIYGILAGEGFELFREEMRHPALLLEESLKSAMCASVGIDHPFHDMLDDIFGEDEDITIEFVPEESDE